jgi:hypothetical protein
LFLDGLDEARSSEEATAVIRIFENLENELSISAKIWISSRDQHNLRKYLNNFQVINVDNYSENDVHEFSLDLEPKFNESSDEPFVFEGRLCKPLTPVS